MASSVALLSACIEDGGELAKRAAQTEEARVTYSAQALKNYALSNASGLGDVGRLYQGPDALRSMLCEAHDGKKGGLFFAWYDDLSKANAGITGTLAREVGAAYTAVWNGGVLVRNGLPLALPDDCPLPRMGNGWPVLVLPVSIITASNEATYRIETQARDCPEGQAGTRVFSRRVEFKPDGGQVFGEWTQADVSGCLDVPDIDVEVKPEVITTKVSQPPKDTEATVTLFADALAANLPDNCKNVTITSTSRTGSTAKKFNTCAEVQLAAIEAPVSPPATVRPPRQPFIIQPCPPSDVVLPTMSSVAEYEAAIAPYKALLPLPARCTLDVRSVAWWPFYQSFVVNDDRAGRIGTYYITRKYAVAIGLWWSASNGASTFTEMHELPRQGWYTSTPTRYTASLSNLPAAFSTSELGQSYLNARINGANYAATYRINGYLHPWFVGPNTMDAGNGNGRYPIIYANEGASPWGNTPTQLDYAVSLPSEVTGNLDERGGGYLTCTGC